MQFCSRCGQPNALRVPPGEDRERSVCSACGTIHYQNPRMIVGCVVEHEGRVLLCRRAIDPRKGFWTLPAGFLELGESAVQGAIRETREEARAEVRVVAPFAHFDVPHIGQAYILYRATLASPELGPGPESLEVGLKRPDELPLAELAFPVVRYSLELLREDLATGRYRSHLGTLSRDPAQGRFVLTDHIAVEIG